MRVTLHGAVAISGLLLAQAVFAQSGEATVKAKCLGCHSENATKVGPSLKAISAKYRDDKAAEAHLVEMLKDPKGHPRIAATDAELKAAIEYVLR